LAAGVVVVVRVALDLCDFVFVPLSTAALSSALSSRRGDGVASTAWRRGRGELDAIAATFK